MKSTKMCGLKMNELSIAALNESFASKDIGARLKWVKETYGDDVILTTSGGKKSMLLPHLVRKEVDVRWPIVFVDHFLYSEDTYTMINHLVESDFDVRKYESEVSVDFLEESFPGWRSPASPYFSKVVKMIKHMPLNRAFEELSPKAWVRGVTWYQTPERNLLDFVRNKNGIIQIHPILDWTDFHIDSWLGDHGLPQNDNHWDPTKGRDGLGECLIGENCGLSGNFEDD